MLVDVWTRHCIVHHFREHILVEEEQEQYFEEGHSVHKFVYHFCKARPVPCPNSYLESQQATNQEDSQHLFLRVGSSPMIGPSEGRAGYAAK